MAAKEPQVELIEFKNPSGKKIFYFHQLSRPRSDLPDISFLDSSGEFQALSIFYPFPLLNLSPSLTKVYRLISFSAHLVFG